MKGARVKINASFPMPEGWSKRGTVIAESESCLGVRLDDVPVPILARKEYVRALTEFNQ